VVPARLTQKEINHKVIPQWRGSLAWGGFLYGFSDTGS
jgi:hypothetical protein